MISSIYNKILPNLASEREFKDIIFDSTLRNCMSIFHSILSNNNELHNLIKIKHSRNKKTSRDLFKSNVLTTLVGMESAKTVLVPYKKKELSAIFQKVNQNCPQGITFNLKDVSTKKITDGLCSAIAFTAMHYILNEDSEESRSTRLLRIAKKFKKGVPQIVAETQAVFNSIQTKPDAEGDFKRNRVQAMANLFDIKLTEAYPTIKYKKLLNRLQHQTATMPEGVYCIRMLWNGNPDTIEDCGHSLVFLREDQQNFLLDSGMALIRLNEDMASEMQKAFTKWGSFDEVRFYRVKLMDVS